MHCTSKVFEQVNRLCPPRNITVQLSTPYTDLEPAEFPMQHEKECICYVTYIMLMWHTCRQLGIFCLYIIFCLSLKKFQDSMMSYLGNSSASCWYSCYMLSLPFLHYQFLFMLIVTFYAIICTLFSDAVLSKSMNFSLLLSPVHNFG